MTKPKKWHLVKEDHGIILSATDGPISKPNASKPLGPILEVSKAPEKLLGKNDEEAVVMVSCLSWGLLATCFSTLV